MPLSIYRSRKESHAVTRATLLPRTEGSANHGTRSALLLTRRATMSTHYNVEAPLAANGCVLSRLISWWRFAVVSVAVCDRSVFFVPGVRPRFPCTLLIRVHRLRLSTPCAWSIRVVLLLQLPEWASMNGVDVQPAAAFSLLMRLCFELRPVDNVRGSNIPILMILHVVLQLRSLAGVRTELDTNALVQFLISSFSAASLDGVHSLLRDALKVIPEQVDVADRVAVRCHEIDLGQRAQ